MNPEQDDPSDCGLYEDPEIDWPALILFAAGLLAIIAGLVWGAIQ